MIAGLPLQRPAELSGDPAAGPLWQLRKGLYATVAGARAVRDHRAAGGRRRPGRAAGRHLRGPDRLFDKHGYGHAVIFGHAKDGNIHFMLTERLGDGGPRTGTPVHRGHGRPRAGGRAAHSRPSTAPAG